MTKKKPIAERHADVLEHNKMLEAQLAAARGAAQAIDDLVVDGLLYNKDVDTHKLWVAVNQLERTLFTDKKGL